MIDPVQIAWAAGFIEGEGCISGKGSSSSIITAAQVHKEPVEHLQKLFGGKLRQRTTRGFSGTPIWIWSLNVRRSIEVMMTIYVLMSPKRQKEIERALSIWRSQKRILKSHGSNFCGRGHELTSNNVYVYGPHRKCKKCRLDAKAAFRVRQRVCNGQEEIVP